MRTRGRIFSQDSSLGGAWSLAAIASGVGANDAVVNFTGCTQTLQTAPSVAVPVLATHNANTGSTFKLAVEGLWVAQFTMPYANLLAGRSTYAVAIGVDNPAGDLSSDPPPVNGTTIKARVIGDHPAGLVAPVMLITTPFAITRAQAKSSTLGLLRVLATDNAGASINAINNIGLGCWLTIHRTGDLPAQIA